ncbi:MAG: hypothetical protein ACP5N2_00235 [Candidatus Nanoarchaeia archaeon]
MINKRILIVLLLLSVLLVTGCAKPISEIKEDRYVDTQVTVKGTVEGTIKLGDLSGYTLKDDSGEIFISSNSLPAEGDGKSVKGIVKKVPLLGTYYIQTD